MNNNTAHNAQLWCIIPGPSNQLLGHKHLPPQTCVKAPVACRRPVSCPAVVRRRTSVGAWGSWVRWSSGGRGDGWRCSTGLQCRWSQRRRWAQQAGGPRWASWWWLDVKINSDRWWVLTVGCKQGARCTIVAVHTASLHIQVTAILSPFSRCLHILGALDNLNIISDEKPLCNKQWKTNFEPGFHLCQCLLKTPRRVE